MLSDVIMEHWIFCNIYTIARKNIKNKILELYVKFTKLIQTRAERRNQTFQAKAKLFNEDTMKIFDIYCEDDASRKRLERVFGVKMTQEEFDFLHEQGGERKMFCESFVDRKWSKTTDRRRKDMQSLDQIRKSDALERLNFNQAVELSSESSMQSSAEISEFSEEPEEMVCQSKKRKMNFDSTDYEDTMCPESFRHIRKSERKIRPEVYETMNRLKSVYHFSETQAAAAVVTVGNKMFGRKWKLHNKATSLDLDTLPDRRNVRQAGKCIETLALHQIVNEIMDTDEKTVVTYADDGSRKQGAGSFSVQGITIHGVFRPLPTLPVASESRRNLADLKVAVLDILSASSGIPTNVLYERIDFIMTDQTSHNKDVEAMVAETLQSEHVPSHLFCNVHPSLMFNREVTKLWADIENTIGKDKIYSKFLVNATTSHNSVTEQALDCITRLVIMISITKRGIVLTTLIFSLHHEGSRAVRANGQDERFNRGTLNMRSGIMPSFAHDVTMYLAKYAGSYQFSWLFS